MASRILLLTLLALSAGVAETKIEARELAPKEAKQKLGSGADKKILVVKASSAGREDFQLESDKRVCKPLSAEDAAQLIYPGGEGRKGLTTTVSEGVSYESGPRRIDRSEGRIVGGGLRSTRGVSVDNGERDPYEALRGKLERNLEKGEGDGYLYFDRKGCDGGGKALRYLPEDLKVKIH